MTTTSDRDEGAAALTPDARIGDLVSEAAAILRAAGVDQSRAEARLLVGAATGWSREDLLLAPDRVPDREAFEAISSLVARRAAREPMSHILGTREFWSKPFRVTRDVLTPRPDSETLVEAVLAELGGGRHDLRVLDLGTGTGCLLLSLIGELPGATGLGIDRSAAALDVAAANAKALGLAGRAAFRLGDWGAGIDGRFDVIVSNPPYIRSADIAGLAPEVSRFEPRAALDGGADGLDAYRRLLPDIRRLLAPGGLAALELGAGQVEPVTALGVANGLAPVGRRRDLAGIERVVVLRG